MANISLFEFQKYFSLIISKIFQGRKLDYDCKKRQGVTDKELKQAEDKFAESLHLAQMGMFNILEADIEQISQLMQFAEALLEYHKQCSEILQVSLN